MPQFSIDQQAVTLSALASLDSDGLRAGLGDAKLATRANWRLVWGRAGRGDASLSVARCELSGTYCIAVGAGSSVFGWETWFDSFDLMSLEPVPGSADTAPMVAAGWAELVRDLLTTKPARGEPSDGKSLQSFLYSLARGVTVVVTGHGRGGAVAQLLACWVKESFPSMVVEARTFGALAVGTSAFATYLAQTLDLSASWVNRADTVARAHSDLPSVQASYCASGPLACPWPIRAIAKRVDRALRAEKINYVPSEDIRALELELVFAEEGITGTQWEAQTEVQHSSETYLHLMSAPLLGGTPAHEWPPRVLRSHRGGESSQVIPLFVGRS